MPSLTPARFPRRTPFRRIASGFTLIEILVVLAILGLLFGLAISNIDVLFGGAKKDTAKLFVTQAVKTPLTAYRLQMNDYPTTAEGLQALLVAPATKADRWHGPYIEDGKSLIDPWGEPYQYRFPGTKNKNSYDIYSKGPDKVDGTDDDIGNWEPAPTAPVAK